MTAQKDISTRAWIEMCLLGAIWGASFFSIRIALNEVPFVTSVLHRTGWAMLAGAGLPSHRTGTGLIWARRL